MELHQLRYFVAVAETGSFGRAAARCRISQPSLSQQIIKLEAKLGRKLFDRLARKTTLTEAGLSLLPRAKSILAEVLEAERDAAGDSAGSRGKLALAAIPTIAPFLLPGVVGDFLELCPDVELTVREDTTDALVEALAAAEIDLAVMSLPLDDARIEHEPLMVEPLFLVASESDARSFGNEVDFNDLDGKAAVVLHELHCLGVQVRSFCRANQVSPRIVCRTSQLATVQSMVSLGLGVSIVPEMCALADTSEQRVYLPFQRGEASRPIVVAWHAGRLRSRLAERFLEVLRAECERRTSARGG